MDEKKPGSEELIVALTLAENEIKHAKAMACSAHIAERIGHEEATKKDTGRALESIDRAMGHLRNVRPRGLDDMLEGIIDKPMVPKPDTGMPRTPEGHINNCALANFVEESECQMCEGNCPDRSKFSRRDEPVDATQAQSLRVGPRQTNEPDFRPHPGGVRPSPPTTEGGVRISTKNEPRYKG